MKLKEKNKLIAGIRTQQLNLIKEVKELKCKGNDFHSAIDYAFECVLRAAKVKYLHDQIRIIRAIKEPNELLAYVGELLKK